MQGILRKKLSNKIAIMLFFLVLSAAPQRTKAGVLADVPCSLTTLGAIAGIGATGFAWYKGVPKYAAPLFGAATCGTFGIASWLFCREPQEAYAINFLLEKTGTPTHKFLKWTLLYRHASKDVLIYINEIENRLPPEKSKSKIDDLLSEVKQKSTKTPNASSIWDVILDETRHVPTKIPGIFLKDIRAKTRRPDPEEYLQNNSFFCYALKSAHRKCERLDMWQQIITDTLNAVTNDEEERENLETYFNKAVELEWPTKR